MLKTLLKIIFPGVSWKNPVLNLIIKAISPIDYIVRSLHGISYLPPYSIRVRSNGVTKQFGGQNFYRYGNQLANHLQTYAFLNNESKVLEIGCGCGRTAFALSNILDKGNFIGMDIERVSLESCKNQPAFIKKGFRFDFFDVHNDEYNPDGKERANTYKFPYDDNAFDVIFLVSVFTHMLTDEVKNYIVEISRMLKPGGICMVTSFLMDKGRETSSFSFIYNEQDHYFYKKSMPEVAIGYYFDFFRINFESCGLKPIHEVLWGSWRNSPEVISSSGFSQDIIFLSKIKNFI